MSGIGQLAGHEIRNAPGLMYFESRTGSAGTGGKRVKPCSRVKKEKVYEQTGDDSGDGGRHEKEVKQRFHG